MKAFVVERYGDASTVRETEVPAPLVGRSDVLVQIHAASVNPIDLKTRDGAFLSDYDLVLDNLGGQTQEKSLQILKPGGKLISIAGPPDPSFAKEIGANPVVRLVMTALSLRTRLRARRHHVSYSFLFMRASGDQLREITSLVEAGKIRPVLDRVFTFDSTLEAMAYVEEGRAKAGKVVITMPTESDN